MKARSAAVLVAPMCELALCRLLRRCCSASVQIRRDIGIGFTNLGQEHEAFRQRVKGVIESFLELSLKPGEALMCRGAAVEGCERVAGRAVEGLQHFQTHDASMVFANGGGVQAFL